jgi:hypothetical protein
VLTANCIFDALRGEKGARRRKLLVKFVAIPDKKEKKKKRKRGFGSAKGLIKMAPDFDEPLEDFKDYM